MAEVTLRSGEIELTPIAESDRPALMAIRSTPEVMARWRGDDLDAEFDEIFTDDETVRLTIRAHGVIVGLVQYDEEDDPEYRHASIDIYVAPRSHRRGIATTAITLVVDHLISGRGHHRLTIDPAADNDAAIACYERVGFRRVGVMRQYEQQADGTWADGLLMELLASEWLAE